MRPRLDIDREELAAFCRRWHIARLALFGSVLRDDFGPDSDVDVLVDFDPPHTPGFLRLHELEQALRPIFGGSELDLVTRQALHPLLRDRILAEALPQYER